MKRVKLHSSDHSIQSKEMNSPFRPFASDLSYSSDIWPQLCGILSQIFRGQEESVNFEKSYRLVYSAVVSGHGEQLTSDLFRRVRTHMKSVCIEVENEDDDDIGFVVRFYGAAVRLSSALAEITKIFLYLDEAFLKPRMSFQLNEEFQSLLKTLLFNIHGQRLLPLLDQFSGVTDLDPQGIFDYLMEQFQQLSPEMLLGYGYLKERVAGISPQPKDRSEDSETNELNWEENSRRED